MHSGQEFNLLTEHGIEAYNVGGWQSLNIKLEKGEVFIHFHGAFHSKNYEGINWYLKHQNPRLKTLTISSHEQASIDKLDSDQIGVADFIIVTPLRLTKTH